MKSQPAISRRRFIEVSAWVGGGLLVGCRMGRGPGDGEDGNAAAAKSGADASAIASATGAGIAFAPNAFVRIGSDGTITLVCHRNEMGQDVHTALAMLVSEELEVDPRSVSIEQAPVDPGSYINAMLGGQITGGSTSVRDAWIPLRTAGATARELLVAAAAARWAVPAGDCYAADGHVVHSAKGKLRYADLAVDAAKRPAPQNVALKPVSAFKVIGKPLPRLDGADKARGRTKYGLDVVLPGMLHAAFAPCPVLGGKVARFDGAKAKARPGVKAVVDIGEGVAVVADHYFTAKSALADLAIEWDEGPGAQVDDGTIQAALQHAASRPGAVVQKVGDVTGSLTRARGGALSARYSTQLLAHMTLEPQNCVALVGPDGVDVHASTQFPQGAQGIAAAAAGVAPEKVRIHAQFIGGGFGRRLDVDFVGQAVQIAKAVPGTPVKLIWSREDDVTHDFYRPPSLHVLEGSVANGRIDALAHKLISPSITNRAFPGVVKDGLDPFMTEGTANLSYAIPNLELRTVIQEVGLRVGYWRSVSHAQNAFAIEGFTDELARAARRDPIAFRVAMLGQMPRQAAVLERAAKEAGYTTSPARGRAFGVASMECYGSHVALIAEVSGSAQAIRIEKLCFAVDCGVAIHPDQVVAQVESGAVTGLINALRAKITLKNGRVVQSNFDDFPIPRMNEVPPIHVVRIESDATPGGMGEVGTPLVAPALANAVFALTGKRIRSLPLEDAGIRFA